MLLLSSHVFSGNITVETMVLQIHLTSRGENHPGNPQQCFDYSAGSAMVPGLEGFFWGEGFSTWQIQTTGASYLVNPYFGPFLKESEF